MKTAAHFLFFMLLGFVASTVVEAQQTSWLKQTWGTQLGSFYVDKAGNSYAGGVYHHLHKTIDGVTLTSNGLENVFAAKYDTKGQLVWAATSSNSSGAALQSQGICANAQGELFISGFFYNSLSFDNITLNANGGATDIFLTKYAANGKALWAKAIGGASSNFTYQVLLDDASNCYLAGSFEYPLSIGDTVLYGAKTGGSKFFIAKFNTDGQLLWVRTLQGMVFCPKIRVTPAGELFAFGQFQEALIWEGDTFFTKGGIDFSILKLQANGQTQWMSILNGKAYNYVHDVCFDTKGDAYLLGSSEGETFLNDSLVYPFSNFNYFVSKLNGQGKLSWITPTPRYRDSTEFFMTQIKTNSDDNPVVYGRLTDVFDTIRREYRQYYGLYRVSFSAQNGKEIQTQLFPKVPHAVWLFEDQWNNLYVSSSFNYQIEVGQKSLDCGYMYAQYLAKIGNAGELVKSSFTLYPNPSTDKVQISFDTWGATAVAYELFHSNGQKVGEGMLTPQNNTLALSHLHTGCYFLRLQDAQAAAQVIKLIKY